MSIVRRRALMGSGGAPKDCVSIYSVSGNTVSVTATKKWNGAIYYSTNGFSWTEWNGSQISSKVIYMKGVGNSIIVNTWSDSDAWVFSCSSNDIWIDGSLEDLRDNTRTVAMGDTAYALMFKNNTAIQKGPELDSPTVAPYCYSDMFRGCTALKYASAFPATYLPANCYASMYYGCTSLETLPSFAHVTHFGDYCMDSMFRGCSKIKVYIDSSEGYNTWELGTSGNTAGTNSLNAMLSKTGGNSMTPVRSRTYYTPNIIIYP